MAKGHTVKLKGHTANVKGHTIKVKGHRANVKGHTIKVKGHTKATRLEERPEKGHKLHFRYAMHACIYIFTSYILYIHSLSVSSSSSILSLACSNHCCLSFMP